MMEKNLIKNNQKHNSIEFKSMCTKLNKEHIFTNLFEYYAIF